MGPSWRLLGQFQNRSRRPVRGRWRPKTHPRAATKKTPSASEERPKSLLRARERFGRKPKAPIFSQRPKHRFSEGTRSKHRLKKSKKTSPVTKKIKKTTALVRAPRKAPQEALEASKMEPRRARSAPGGHQGRSKTASVRLLERSWRLFRPSWGRLGISWAAPGPSWAAPGGHFGLLGITFSRFFGKYFWRLGPGPSKFIFF